MWWAKYGSTTEFVLRVGGGDWSSSPLCSLTLVLASRLATVAGRLLDDVELEEGEGCGFEEDIACSMGEEIPGGSPIVVEEVGDIPLYAGPRLEGTKVACLPKRSEFPPRTHSSVSAPPGVLSSQLGLVYLVLSALSSITLSAICNQRPNT